MRLDKEATSSQTREVVNALAGRGSKPEEFVLDALVAGRAVPVRELVAASKLGEEEVLEAVKRLEEDRKVKLNESIPSNYAFAQYLKDSSYSLWLHLAILASLSTLATIYLLPSTYPLVVSRWILGSLFILYLPGFALVEALFPKRGDLTGVERIALSIGLSLAATPLIGLLLNYTPWGIRLDPIAASLSVFTLGIALLAAYRKFLAAKVPPGLQREA